MSAAWAKFKLWTRVIIFSAAAIYVLLFIIVNHGTPVTLHFVFKKLEISVLLLLLITSIISIVGWWLFKTLFLTVQQMRSVNRQAELSRAEKAHAERLAKASKLQVKPDSSESQRSTTQP